MKQILLTQLAILLASSLLANDPPESDFYTETIQLVDSTVNLVSDYGANVTDSIEDSDVLQNAINDMAKLPNGGVVVLPQGKYVLMSIFMKSNVHLIIDSKAVIYPGKMTKDKCIFLFGMRSETPQAMDTIRNTSIRSNDGAKFRVNLNALQINVNFKVASFRNVQNFRFSDLYLDDNWTHISALTLSLSEYLEEDGTYHAFRPEHGLIKNIFTQESHPGYGVVQQQLGKLIYYKNMSGGFGNTLRMESGASHSKYDGQHHSLNNDSIWGRDLSCTGGGCVLSLNPHTRKNGHIDMRRLIGYGCRFVVYTAGGFTNAEDRKMGRTPGTYAHTGIVANVHGVFGTEAYAAPRFHKYIPCELRHLISEEKTPEGVHYWTPSAATICDRARNDDDGAYAITYLNVTQEGFQYRSKTIINDDDIIKTCPTQTALAAFNQNAINVFPNPATDKITITKPTNASILIYNMLGIKVRSSNDSRSSLTLSLEQLDSGIYILIIQSGAESYKETLIIN